MLRVNGGFLHIDRYDRVLSALLDDQVLIPQGFRRFAINRKKIPAA